MTEVTEVKPLSIPEERVSSLIEAKTAGDPAKRAELSTRAGILRPLLISPDNLGLTSEEETTVRKYARVAGERVGKEAVSLLEKSPIERIDQILYEVAQKLPTDDWERILSLPGKSGNLRNWVRAKQERVVTVQQVRELDGKPSSFDEVVDYLLSRVGATGISSSYELGKFNPATAERILKQLGLLKPDMTLETLRSSNKWNLAHPSNLHGQIGYTTPDRTKSPWGNLDTNIPGLKVLAVEEKNEYARPNEPGTKFFIHCEFSSEVMKDILRAPAGNSLFDAQPTEVVSSVI